MILVNRAAARSRTGTFPPSPACSPPVLTVAQPLGRLGFLFPHDHVRGGAGTAVGSTTLTSRPGSSPTRARLWGTPRSGGGATSGRGARTGKALPWRETTRGSREAVGGLWPPQPAPVEQAGACVVDPFFAAMPTLALSSIRYSSRRRTLARTMAAAAGAPLEQAGVEHIRRRLWLSLASVSSET
jgi:hypothetical protein